MPSSSTPRHAEIGEALGHHRLGDDGLADRVDQAIELGEVDANGLAGGIGRPCGCPRRAAGAGAASGLGRIGLGEGRDSATAAGASNGCSAASATGSRCRRSTGAASGGCGDRRREHRISTSSPTKSKISPDLLFGDRRRARQSARRYRFLRRRTQPAAARGRC